VLPNKKARPPSDHLVDQHITGTVPQIFIAAMQMLTEGGDKTTGPSPHGFGSTIIIACLDGMGPH
jgi:hypothetical protein